MQGKKCTQYKRKFCLLQLFTVYVFGVFISNPCKAKQIYVDENLTQLVVGN